MLSSLVIHYQLCRSVSLGCTRLLSRPNFSVFSHSNIGFILPSGLKHEDIGLSSALLEFHSSSYHNAFNHEADMLFTRSKLYLSQDTDPPEETLSANKEKKYYI